LLCGVVLTAPAAKDVEIAARAAGFLVNAAAPDVIRLAPPLIIAEQQIDTFVAALPGILDRASDDAGRPASRGGVAHITPASEGERSGARD
jgi:acetylornithine aminotransferase